MAIITPTIRIFDSKLMVKDRTILTNVPDNKMGNIGSEIPMETQFLLVKIKDGYDHLPFRGGAR
ncbi:hypothetical protein R3W88_018971 [Solanum pinnatisectum]|uniref:Uncharacterized protein n=1 Tax=Solanum pinnatisectum TaxID=50273 RepID=A0AAV9KIC2_9SOLN|nr:hypothetical protein R3W88_018971 [Solanum pinnatisectum]